jgi:hypothetical protein
MEFDGCFPTSQASAAALPAVRQFLRQRNAATIFEHHTAEAVHQFQRDGLLGLHQDADHFFQDRMQELGTRLIETLMHCCLAHIHFSNGCRRGQGFQAGIGRGEPAEDQRLNEISSTPFSLPLNAARLASQYIGPLFSYLFQRVLDL